MCGIGGWFGPNADGNIDSMRAALEKRGPDGSGVWRSDRTVLVHTRLAILDLSEAGSQPMLFQSEGGGTTEPDIAEESVSVLSQSQSEPVSAHRPSQMVLVFNGEIYNHRDLRSELEAEGETFTGHSDSEVLLRLLAKEGTDCLPRLAGMFAFAFWDEVRGEALLVRDPLGIKPLYYRIEDELLSFASEASILGESDDCIDSEALRDFFLWGSVTEPSTLNSSVKQLSAGCLMKWKNGRCSVEHWSDPVQLVCKQKPLVARSSTAKVARAALEESIKRHLVSDVPVGIFLSGGIDSTVILALARQVLGPGADIRTFSIGFSDPAFDESSLARRTALHFGAIHTEWKMSTEEGATEIPDFLAAMDQPSIDGFNTWCVSKLARREGMKVVLSGLGGDEFFAGYGSFRRVPQYHSLFSWLGPFRYLISRILDGFPSGTPWRRVSAFLRGNGSWLSAFHAQRGIFTPEEAELLTKAISGESPKPFDWDQPDLPQNPKEIVSWLEASRYMRNQLLRDSDVFSMAHGLELRVPLVDVRLAETLLSLPSEQRLRQGKKLLLDAVPEVPEWIRNQPKRGFRFPFQQWMEGQFGELLDYAQEASPVPLKAWYRTWAVAVAVRQLATNKEKC